LATTLRALAELVGGELVGMGDRLIYSALPMREAGTDDITFLESDKFISQLESSSAGAALVPFNVTLAHKNQIRVTDPLSAFIAVVRHFKPVDEQPPIGIHPKAIVHHSATIGSDASVHPLAVVGSGCVIGNRCRLYPGVVLGRNCRLGDDVTLYPQVTVYDNTIIGHRVIIHANAVIGADGFGYRFQGGKHIKVPQMGHVEIGDDVEIGAGTTIDRGTFSATRIGAGTKIDNLVMIAHNCQIGKHNVFVSQMGMAGSSSTGDYVIIAGQVGVVEHVHIGDRSVIGGQAAVTKDVPPDSRMLGSPATEAKEQMRILKSLQHLPEWRKELKSVQEKLGLAG